MKLKRLSLFLALVMILSAFAGTFTIAGAAGGNFEIWRNDAKVSEYTGTITAAITAGAIEAGDTVKLTSNYESTSVEAIGVAITIDCNGYTVTTNSSSTRIFNTTANITIQNGTLTTKLAGGAVQMNGSSTTLTLNNLTINATVASSYGAVVVTGASQTLNVNNCKFSLKGPAVFSNGANATIVFNDSSIISAPSGAIHAFVQTQAANATIKFNNTFVQNTGSTITRVASTYGAGTTVEIKDSQMFVLCSDAAVEFNASNQETPSKVTIENSAIIGCTNDVVDTDAAAAYVEITIKDSYLRADKLGLDLNGANAPVDISGSSIVTGLSAIEASADSVIAVANSALRSTTEGTAAVTGATPTYTASVTGSGMTLTQIGTNLEGDALYAFAGAPFRAGTTYYNTLATAAAENAEVFVIGDYYSAGREAYGSMTTLTGVANANGEYPTVYTAQRFTANVTTAMTFQNFTISNTYADCTIQINAGGVLTLNNMTVVADRNNGCLVLQKGSKVIINNSTIDAMGSCGVRFNETAEGQVPVAEVNNSVLKASKGGYAVWLLVSGIMNISEDSQVIVDDVDGFGIGSKTLTLNGKEITSNIVAATMLTGASVRIARGNELAQSGIRFESTLSAEIIAEVNAMIDAGTIKNATVGTVVFKKSDLGNKTVAELVEAANADADDALIVADIEAREGVVLNEDNSATIRAAIINIKEKNYGVEFGAVAYIELTCENGATVRIYGEFDAINNVRSIKGVAEAALADTKTEAGVVDGYNYYNEIAEGVYSCYSDEQIAILNTYAGK